MKAILSAFLVLGTIVSFAQNDTKQRDNVFHRITKEVQQYRVDTSDAPDDRITRKIQQLKNLRGGFNIQEAIAFKIQEDESKNEMSKEELQKIRSSFTSGDGRRWIENASIWIYRDHFTYKELKQLVKFYRTSAGRKMADDFPVIMLKNFLAAQTVQVWITGK